MSTADTVLTDYPLLRRPDSPELDRLTLTILAAMMDSRHRPHDAQASDISAAVRRLIVDITRDAAAPDGDQPVSPVITHPDRSQTWTTTHGDTVTVYPTIRLGDIRDMGKVFGWRWRVQATNGEILESGEQHPRRRNARVAAVRHHPPLGAVTDTDAAAVTRFLAWLVDHDCAVAHADHVPPTVFATAPAQHAAMVQRWADGDDQ